MVGQAGETVLISLNSTQLDSFLTLQDTTGRVIAENDDAGGTTNSKIRVTLPQTGTYRVGVRGLNRWDAGQYTLNIQSGDIEPPATSPGQIGDRHTNYLFRGETLQHTFGATVGETVTLLLESNQFDTYLTLYGPDGLLIAENDDADNTNSRLTLQLPQTGICTPRFGALMLMLKVSTS